MVVIKEKTKDKITMSFSGSVSAEGLKNIKSYIEFVERMGKKNKQKKQQPLIKEIADDITAAGWSKLKAMHKL